MVRHMIMTKRQLLLISSSKVHGHDFLHYPKNGLENFLQKNSIKQVLFIPYAACPSEHANYSKKVSEALKKFGVQTTGLNEYEDLHVGVNSAECIFIGGGNTFRLLHTLYTKNLIEPISKKVLIDGVPYIGSSAGTNVATPSIKTSNDMPIIYPQSFDAFNFIPFNINPHYMEPDPRSTHQGETRAQRISEFHQVNCTPVLGLPEGASLLVEGDQATLLGEFVAKLFLKGSAARNIEPNADLSVLLKWVEPK